MFSRLPITITLAWILSAVLAGAAFSYVRSEWVRHGNEHAWIEQTNWQQHQQEHEMLRQLIQIELKRQQQAGAAR